METQWRRVHGELGPTGVGDHGLRPVPRSRRATRRSSWSRPAGGPTTSTPTPGTAWPRRSPPSSRPSASTSPPAATTTSSSPTPWSRGARTWPRCTPCSGRASPTSACAARLPGRQPHHLRQPVLRARRPRDRLQAQHRPRHLELHRARDRDARRRRTRSSSRSTASSPPAPTTSASACAARTSSPTRPRRTRRRASGRSCCTRDEAIAQRPRPGRASTAWRRPAPAAPARTGGSPSRTSRRPSSPTRSTSSPSSPRATPTSRSSAFQAKLKAARRPLRRPRPQGRLLLDDGLQPARARHLGERAGVHGPPAHGQAGEARQRRLLADRPALGLRHGARGGHLRAPPAGRHGRGNPAHRARAEELWKLPARTLNPKVGSHITKMMRDLEDGSLQVALGPGAPTPSSPRPTPTTGSTRRARRTASSSSPTSTRRSPARSPTSSCRPR